MYDVETRQKVANDWKHYRYQIAGNAITMNGRDRETYTNYNGDTKD